MNAGRKKKMPWILACDGSNPELPYGFVCLRCGAKEPVQTPIPMAAWLAWAKGFQAAHTFCQEKAK